MDIENNQIQIQSYFLKNDRTDVNGRLYFDYVVLTIHNNKDEYQDNHICWLEENIRKNLDSAQNMPLVAQFVDETKSEPLGHGYVTRRNGKPVIIDSEQVGSIVKAEIKNVDVQGSTIKALVATAYINELRYPQLCQWLRATMFEEKAVSTSVEIFAKKGNETIVSEYIVKEDVEICVPIDFDFGGSAILTMTPADENAIVLEILNSRRIIENQKKEEENMNEELQAKLEASEKKSAELEIKINTLEEEKQAVEEDKVAAEEAKTQLEEANAELASQVEKLTEEKENLENFKKEQEEKELVETFDEAVADFDEELVSEVKDDIEDFKKEPTSEKSEAIINSLNALFVKKVKSLKTDKVEKKEDVKVNSLFVSIEEADEGTEPDVKIWE